MKTHGGRAFLHGHLFGDNVHEYLAPCIYEGEGEMLGMAFFKSLVKQHGVRFFEPIGKALQAAGIKKPNPLNPRHAWALRGVVGPYLRWLASEHLRLSGRTRAAPRCPQRSRAHAEFAASYIGAAPLVIDRVLRKHQLALADRQCRMSHPLAADPRRGGDSDHEPVRGPAGRRAHPPGSRLHLPGPDPQADRPAADRPLLPHGHLPGRAHRLRRLPLHRRPACRTRF